MARRKDSPQKAAMRELMRDYLKNNDITVKDDTDVNSIMRDMMSVLLEGAIIILACIIFSLFAASPPAVDPDAAVVTMVWSYIGELVFNMLILVGTVKMADRIVKEMMGL